MKWAALLCIATIVLFSCGKEKSIEGALKSSDSLLVKMESHVGTYSISYTYGYDDSRRLISQDFSEVLPGTSSNEQIAIRRDAQGVILQVIHKSDSLSANGLDSLVYNVNYDASNSRYSSGVARFTLSGNDVSDSIAYTYNGSGKVALAEEFIGNAALGGYAEYQKTEYGYDGSGNVNDVKTSKYDTTSSAYIVVSESAYEYDNNVNPLDLGSEAALVNNIALFSSHNITKRTTTYPSDPTRNEIYTIVYTYNSENKPASAVGTYSGLGVSAPVSYTYQ